MKSTKQLLLALFFAFTAQIIFSNVANAQDFVPKKVKEAFKKQKPNVKKVEWEKEGANFEAEFMENGVENELVFDKNGKLIAKETKMKTSALSQSIKNAVSKNYTAYKIVDAEKVEMNGKTYFEVEIEKSGKEMELLYDKNGKFIKKIVEDEDDTNDDD